MYHPPCAPQLVWGSWPALPFTSAFLLAALQPPPFTSDAVVVLTDATAVDPADTSALIGVLSSLQVCPPPRSKL